MTASQSSERMNDFYPKSVSATEFYRKPSAVWKYLETAGRVVFFTRRG